MTAPRRLVSRLMAILLVAAVLPARMDQARAQGGIVVEEPGVVVNFGRSITFQARIQTPIPIQQVSLLFRGVHEDVTRVETVQVAEDGFTSFTYDVSLNVFPPFSWIVFWYQATLSDGNTYTSPPIQFQYYDDRFPWRKLSRANITLSWYAGDDAFATAALDTAGRGLLAMNEFIPISLNEPIHVYVYSNPSDLQDTLLLGGVEWSGGHTHHELGIAMVAIAPGPGQSIEMETKIPHELAHLMLFRALGAQYERQPAWLVEGIASTMELYPNPEYERALRIASENNSLIPFTDLCASLPADTGSAFLAYAQSQSFVTYIRDSFGSSGLARLISAYGDGFSCELGATQALGSPLSQLDRRWRETVLGQNVAGVALRNLLPFLLLLALVLFVPFWGAMDFLRQRRKHGKFQ